MKFLVGCLFSAFLACSFSSLYAQTPAGILQGKVLTETKLPAEGSTIVLLKFKDSSIVNSTIAGKNGSFQITEIQPDGYLLLVSKVGYAKSYSGPYHVLSAETFTVPDIILKPSVKQLNEVSVVSNKPDVEVRQGKVILNIQNSLLADGNSAYDILRESPGVRVDNNNNISIVGRQTALITIDGKTTSLSGDDLIGILRGMQSNTIDRIELITSGSAKYDASGGGIINIVLKKGKNTGANASFTASGGYGKYSKGNAGIVFNNRTDNFNIFGSYGYSGNETFHNFVTDRVIDYNNSISDYHVNYNTIQTSYNNNFSLGTDFYLSPTQTIGFLVNGSIRKDDFAKDNDLIISNQGVMDSSITANSILNRNVHAINYNLNYNGKFGDKGATLSADLNYTTYNRTSAEYITNEFFDASGNTYKDPEWLQNLSPSDIKIWLSKVDFSGPLSKTSKLEAGIKFSDVTSSNDLIFGPNINGHYVSDPAFSDHFNYTENVNAAYLNYQSKFKKFELAAGLRAEQTNADGNSVSSGQVVNSSYLDFFPNVLLTFKKDDKHDFSLSYNRGIIRPAYEDINPFLYYVDLYDYRSGNPGLKPEYTNTFEFTYNYNKSLMYTLYTSVINNAYEFPFYEQDDASKLNITTQKNLGKVYNYGFRFFAPVVFTHWWNANFNVDASYQRYVAYPENGNLNKGTQDVILSTNQYFIMSPTLTAEILGAYESPTFYGINQLKAVYSVNAGIGKQLFNKRASLKLNVSDIFNTKRDRGYTNYENLNITTVDKKETQVVRLTFTYRFGKASIRSSTHRTGNEEEQKRTSASGTN